MHLSDIERGLVLLGENLLLLRELPDASIDLIYIDPPFNTGSPRSLEAIETRESESGRRTGFKGRRYESKVVSSRSYDDSFDNYLGFLKPRLVEARRVLASHGSLYFHIDYREAHYCKILLDEIFGRNCFLNEIIWAYDYGGRARKRWPPKHDNIFLYVKDPKNYYFSLDEVDRIPYMAPSLVTEEKRKRGKTPTDTWWHTIVSPTGKEKTGYPTQKPVAILKRMIAASCPPNGIVLDFFAGSGSAGAAALELGRRFLLVDRSEDAYEVMRTRFANARGIKFETLLRPRE